MFSRLRLSLTQLAMLGIALAAPLVSPWVVREIHADGGAETAEAADSAQKEGREARERPLRFESEIVRLWLEGGDSLEVEGLYRFVCAESAPKRFSLLYPFPAEDMGGARVLSCEYRGDDDDWVSMPFKAVPVLGGVVWQLPLAGARRCEVRTRYRQALLDSRARYIVTTVKGWRHPLEHARFEAFIAAELGTPEFNHPFAVCDSLGDRAWCFEARDFRPEEDIIVTW